TSKLLYKYRTVRYFHIDHSVTIDGTTFSVNGVVHHSKSEIWRNMQLWRSLGLVHMREVKAISNIMTEKVSV
ncbi:hypothetical protein PMAYCL1PPCAC_27235, partial [Pristionchus mayeri]